jgi:multidrug resistance efflux pump
MAEQEKTPEQVLKEQIWKYTGHAALWTTFFASGMILGYLLWADACGRCEAVKDLTAKVSAARAEVETVKAQEGQKYRALEREKEGLQRQIDAAKGGQPTG